MLEALRLLISAVVPTPDSERERMHRFLSQARDRAHLEQLEREWFRSHARRW